MLTMATLLRVQLRPLHSNELLTRLIVTVDDEKMELIRTLQKSTETELFKTKVLDTYFKPKDCSRHKVVGEAKIKTWFNKLRDFNDEELMSNYKPIGLAKLQKGDFFKFKDKNTVMVYDGKLTKDGRFHYHPFEDTNDIRSLKNAAKLIETNFEF